MARLRQRLSMFRLNKWLSRSYLGAISEKMRWTYARFSAPPAAAALAVAVSMSVASIKRKLPGSSTRGKLSYARLPTMPTKSYTDVSDQQVVIYAQEGREDAYRELIHR